MRPAGDSPVRPDLPAPDAAPVRLFAESLTRLWPEGEHGDARLGLAVSGGPDSCALLLLSATALPGRIVTATVDHGLRAESADEAAFVSRLCEALGVPHAVLRVTVQAGNVQSEARAARYAALQSWASENGLSALATAHHADDQAETLLLRLNRASGVAGLAGARARTRVPGGTLPLLRPLLGWRRAELAEVVSDAGIAAISDPSNLDDRFDRARLRKALASADWLDMAAMARSAANLADADEALDWAARREWDEAVRKQPFGLSYRPRAPRAVALRVLARIVRELSGEDARGGQIAAVHDCLVAGSPASIGNLVVRCEREGWVFAAAPRRRETR